MGGTDGERGDIACGRETRNPGLNEFFCVVDSARLESEDPEFVEVGVGSASTFKSLARIGGSIALVNWGPKDGGDGQKGRDQELNVGEHWEGERREVASMEDGVGCDKKAN